MNISEFKAPYYSYEDIRIEAENFLNTYNPNDDIPVPIEEIIEFKLGIDIIPVPNLHGGYETDGWISEDFKSIYVDLYVYNNYEHRYLFTLAHEIGHKILHKELYGSDLFSNKDEWKEFINGIDPKQYGFLEYHANCFAGLILVPDRHIKDSYQEAISLVTESGFNVNETNKDIVYSYISRFLKEKYLVSSDTIRIRLELDGLIEK